MPVMPINKQLSEAVYPTPDVGPACRFTPHFIHFIQLGWMHLYALSTSPSGGQNPTPATACSPAAVALSYCINGSLRSGTNFAPSHVYVLTIPALERLARACGVQSTSGCVPFALQVGPVVLLQWFGHFFSLLAYSCLHTLLGPVRQMVRSEAVGGQGQGAAGGVDGALGSDGGDGASQQDLGRKRWGYPMRRFLDALEFGSSSDYQYHKEDSPPSPPTKTNFGGSTAQQAAARVAEQEREPMAVPAHNLSPSLSLSRADS